MRRTLRVIAVASLWALGVCVFVVVSILAINAFDEKPNEASQKLAASSGSAIPDSDNAYLALIGFDAPVGTEPIAEGRRLVAEHDMATAADPWGLAASTSPNVGTVASRKPGQLRFEGRERMGFCDPLRGDVQGQAPVKRPELNSLHAANQTLVDRYIAVQKLNGFAVVAQPSVLEPVPVAEWSPTQQLLLCESVVEVLTQSGVETLSFVDDDLRFWRRVLAGDGNLISEMIATAFLARDLRVVSAIIATPTFPVEVHATEFREMLTPMNSPGSGMSRALAREYALQAALLRGLPNWPEPVPPLDETWEQSVERALWSKRVAGWLFKPQASLNLSAANFDALIVLADTEPGRFATDRMRLRASMKERGEVGLGHVYNPVGKILVGIAAPEYDDYIARVFDLAAYVHLVRAQLEMRLAARQNGVVEYPVSAGRPALNPYDGKPFAWDRDKATLSFEPTSKRWREWSTTVPAGLRRSDAESPSTLKPR
jgi:hypothetical protein